MTRCLVMLCVLAAAFGGGCLDDVVPGTKPPCMENAEKTVGIDEPTDAATDFQLRTCAADVDACNSLCALLMMKNNIDGMPTSCDVRFGDTHVTVTIHYTFMRPDADNCPVFVADGGLQPGGPKH